MASNWGHTFVNGFCTVCGESEAYLHSIEHGEERDAYPELGPDY